MEQSGKNSSSGTIVDIIIKLVQLYMEYLMMNKIGSKASRACTTAISLVVALLTVWSLSLVVWVYIQIAGYAYMHYLGISVTITLLVLSSINLLLLVIAILYFFHLKKKLLAIF